MAWLFLGAVLGVVGTLAVCAAVVALREHRGHAKREVRKQIESS